MKNDYRSNPKKNAQSAALNILEITYCMRDNPVSERTLAVCAIPESPVNETAAADRIVFMFSLSEEVQIARTPVVISSDATRGRLSGELMSRTNSARTEKRMTKPPTWVMTVKLSMIELLREVMKERF